MNAGVKIWANIRTTSFAGKVSFSAFQECRLLGYDAVWVLLEPSTIKVETIREL
jgi:hypothetical protein